MHFRFFYIERYLLLYVLSFFVHMCFLCILVGYLLCLLLFSFPCVFSWITAVLVPPQCLLLLLHHVVPVKCMCVLGSGHAFESTNSVISELNSHWAWSVLHACVSVVLSSDEEESCDSLQHRSPTVHALVSMEDTVIQTQSSQEAETKLQTASDTQAMEVGRTHPGVTFDP